MSVALHNMDDKACRRIKITICTFFYSTYKDTKYCDVTLYEYMYMSSTYTLYIHTYYISVVFTSLIKSMRISNISGRTYIWVKLPMYTVWYNTITFMSSKYFGGWCFDDPETDRVRVTMRQLIDIFSETKLHSSTHAKTGDSYNVHI